jgi:glucokinase
MTLLPSQSCPPTDSLLAIEIGGTKLQVCAGGADGTIIDRRVFVVDRRAGADGIRGRIEEALPALLAAHRPRAVGVGYGGPVDWRTGRIWRSYHIEGWSDFPLGDWLRSLTALPVHVDNDGNVAALGEACRGAGRGRSPVMYVTLGSGVGAGLVIGESIYHGDTPGELELGHVRLNEAGLTVQQRCSGWAVDAIVREAAMAHPSSILGGLVRDNANVVEGGESKCLGPALDRACPLATQILRDTMHQLAFALSHATHLLHPQVIVIGGGLSLLGEPLRAALAAELPRFLMDAFAPGPIIALAELKEDAVPVGALVLAGRCGDK